jgi:hypothetical protein
MVKRFPELQWVDQGLTAAVISIQFVQLLAGNQKRSDRFAIISKPDSTQLSTPAQKKRSSINVRGLKAVFNQKNHPLFKKIYHPIRQICFSYISQFIIGLLDLFCQAKISHYGKKVAIFTQLC